MRDTVDLVVSVGGQVAVSQFTYICMWVRGGGEVVCLLGGYGGSCRILIFCLIDSGYVGCYNTTPSNTISGGTSTVSYTNYSMSVDWCRSKCGPNTYVYPKVRTKCM
jgi:hypothetical protein